MQVVPRLLADAIALLAVPSTAGAPDQLGRALDLVVAVVGEGYTVERFTSRGRPSALLYPGARPERFRVVLNAHLDVVPGDPDQFLPRLDGDRLYARGAQDMKLTALAMAYAFRDRAGGLDVPVALQLVCDEEIGGFDGTLHQLESGVRADFAVIGEHSRLDIVADSKGIMRVRLHAVGRGAHGAYPWLGVNALDRLVEALHRIATHYPTPAGPQWTTTVNLARIVTTNQAVNQVPADAEAELDVRFPAEDGDIAGRTPEQIAAHFARFCPAGVSVSVDHLDPPFAVDHEAPDVLRLRDAARAQGYPAQFLYKHGAGDGRHFAKFGIPAVVFGVGGDGQHGPNEYAEVSTVDPYYRALCHFLDGVGVR